MNARISSSTDFLHVMLVQRAECYRLSVATCAVTHQATNRTVNGRSHPSNHQQTRKAVNVITAVFSALATTSTFQGLIYLLLVGIPASDD
ncbi:hypothetical protein [Peribacillus butanolivorans]|uniref:hypothetical protein n=1 Tax=Peribacillus butanolivorans TaxID=421767 RepID=UPI00366E80ED